MRKPTIRVHVEPLNDLACVECNGEGFTRWRCSPQTCGWCREDFRCYYDGCAAPCEECATGAAWARDNGFPETLFAIEERKARRALA